MSNYIIPVVGMRGRYDLSPPMDQKVLTGEEYTCRAVRQLSDYVANNEDAKADIYEMNGMTAGDYDRDLAENMHIASLQSDTGHWVHVPVRYIQSYPDPNGVPYRTLMIGVSVGPQPVDKDFSFLEEQIKDLVVSSIGVTPVVKQVQTSKTVLVPVDKHEQMKSAREARSAQGLTDGLRYKNLLIQHQRALDQVKILEDYIRQNLPVGQ